MRRLLSSVLLIIGIASSLSADDFSFEMSDLEEKTETMHFSGSLDLKYTLLRARDSSPFYRLQFQDVGLSELLTTYSGGFYFNGNYQTEKMALDFKTYTEYYDDTNLAFDFTELYGSVDFSLNSSLVAGKKVYNWGKGYAFNPVGFVNPQKDPENPELAKAGRFSANYQYNKSFNTTALTNFTFDLIVLPAEEKINDKISELENTDIAAKFYFLVYDTDIDLMTYYSSVNSSKIGIDFARNISTNLEFHGEVAYLSEQQRYAINNSHLSVEKADAISLLGGIRWLSESNFTTILEYYHNQSGMNNAEFSAYYDYISAADSVSAGLISKTNKEYFSAGNLMQDYLYLKLSYPEPFEILYFTPSVYTVFNFSDQSFTAGMPLSYKPITNSEFILTPILFSGKAGSEYGSKSYLGRIELKGVFYF